MEKRDLSLNELIDQLNHFAEQRFPVQEVGQFMRGHIMSEQELAPYTFFESDRYTRNLIHKSEAFELLAICWQPGQDSPVHGHEGEKCWSRVEAGKLRFTNYLAVPSGEFFDFEVLSVNVGSPGHLDGPAEIHKVENAFDEPAISLHLYSYPFEACDIYDVEKHLTDRKTLSYYSQHGTRCQ
jgi:predicted metal-dependent enzyme (double-stranded beta helix superfamily)